MKKAAVILLLVLLTAAFALPGSADMNKYSTVFMDTFDTVISLIGYAENQETFHHVDEEKQQESTETVGFFACFEIGLDGGKEYL